jgi:hypothetical protein
MPVIRAPVSMRAWKGGLAVAIKSKRLADDQPEGMVWYCTTLGEVR